MRHQRSGISRQFGALFGPEVLGIPTSVIRGSGRGLGDLARTAGTVAVATATGGTGAGLIAGIQRLRGGSEGTSGSGVVPSAAGDIIPGVSIGSLSEAGDCPGLFSVRVAGRCVNLGDLGPGGSPAVTEQTTVPIEGMGGDAFGEAVNGRYGVGLLPGVVASTRRICPHGAVLGNDGVCYDPTKLRARDREWIPPRKPLLTGGELNAIATASRAAKKIQTTTKRLQKLGMLPKAKTAPKRITTAAQHHAGA